MVGFFVDHLGAQPLVDPPLDGGSGALAMRLMFVSPDRSTGNAASVSEAARPFTIRMGMSGRRAPSSSAIRAKTVTPLSGYGLMKVTYFGSGASAMTQSSGMGSAITGPSNPIRR